MIVSGYRAMWVVAMFDLPVDTPAARKAYTDFRKSLLRDGFVMLQYSVYARCCPSEENAAAHAGRVRGVLPPDGEVRLLTITDKQFGRMEIFFGRIRRPVERGPRQLELF